MRRFVWCLLVVCLLSLSGGVFASALSSYSSVVPQYSQPSFQTYYGAAPGAGLGSSIATYWPALDKETCQARQDLLLHVAPAGCQPQVVRSDLLAEQDVPVFCQLDALQLNPLLNIKEIRSIRFGQQYPKDVRGIGFHPARAALRTRDDLLGSPLINNVGYVVVVLKQQPKEKDMPDFVSVNLSADIEYTGGNAFGVGSASFVLSPQSEQEWNTDRSKQTFWQGRYAVRLEEADVNQATFSIYEGDRKISQTRVKLGGTSSEIYVPGFYCQAGLQVSYDSFEHAQRSARIEVSADQGVDAFDVYEGSSFLNKCKVTNIFIQSAIDNSGRVEITCGSDKRILTLKSRVALKTGDDMIDPIISQKLSIVQSPAKQESCEVALVKGTNGAGTSAFAGVNGMYYIQRSTLGSIAGSEWTLHRKVVGAIKDLSPDERTQQWAKNLQSELAAKCEQREAVLEKAYDADTETWFKTTIASYEKLAKEYPAEHDSVLNVSYGEGALEAAIALSEKMDKQATAARLIRDFIATYPGSPQRPVYEEKLERISHVDSSGASTSLLVDNRPYTIRLKSLKIPPIASTNIELSINGKHQILQSDTFENLTLGTGEDIRIIADQLLADSARIKVFAPASCKQKQNTPHVVGETASEKLRSFGSDIGVLFDSVRLTQGTKIRVGDTVTVCGATVTLDRVNIGQVAKIRLEPLVRGTRSTTNVSVQVGIEKRAIKLSPNKTLDRITELNQSIQKWSKISNTLGDVVTGMKGACFATSAALTFKNFYQGLSGAALARQEVMNGPHGWKNICKDLVPAQYSTLDACYADKAGDIEKDVAARTAVITKVNADITAVQGKHPVSNSALQGNSIDSDAAKKDLAQILREKYGSQQIDTGVDWGIPGETREKTISVSRLLDEKNLDSISYSQMRVLYAGLESRQASGFSASEKKNIDDSLQDVAQRVQDNRYNTYLYASRSVADSGGVPKGLYLFSEKQQPRVTDIVPKAALQTAGSAPKVIFAQGADAMTSPYVTSAHVGASVKGATFKAGDYLVGLEKTADGNYAPREVFFKESDGKYVKQDKPEAFFSAYNIGLLQEGNAVSYSNPFKNPEVRYYETEPYKGLPALVPFDLQHGWYAATKQTLPAMGGIGAFDASGRVASFWLCNVGKNGRADFEESGNDDICQMINLNTGQPRGLFPGISESDAKRLVDQAVTSLQEAANQYKQKGNQVNVHGHNLPVGKPATGTPSTQCQDFMSPTDCNLLFNVCDPVICPPSRCNLGGAYPVTDVVQTGIIGSTLLCLPNFPQVKIPVCLTGIHAGIDNYVSILKNYRDCLQESVTTGKSVGICDQITSIYTCEFFWKEVAPLANLVLPKLIESAYGQGARGGGEYLTVMSAWQNMQKSVDYFTNSYGVNSLKAYQARSVEEVGGQFCKAFISAKAPTSIKTLLAPDSPPQFSASFSSTPFTTATVPATSQYKVFYHIFAGNDAGIYYRVFLKNPPSSSYYYSVPTVQVAAGFIARGQYASETRDFTAPQGYGELCVTINGDEKCGFKQVSTSFAVNYARDTYVADQSKDQNIDSDSSCVSGSPSLGGTIGVALTNTNPEAAADEALDPAIYKRGVIRICSSKNPGSTTNPTRFVDVGSCDDPKIHCWLDKDSVDRAITSNNIGVRNQTLKDLNALTQQSLEKQGIVTNDAAAVSELKVLQDATASVAVSFPALTDVKALMQRMDYLFDLLYWNHHKAQLLFLKAKVNEKVLLTLFDKVQEQQRAAEQAATSSRTGEGDVAAGDTSQRVSEQMDTEALTRIGDTYVYKEVTPLQVEGASTSRDIYLRYNGALETPRWEWSLDQQTWKPVDSSVATLEYARVQGLSNESHLLLTTLISSNAEDGASFITGVGGKISTRSSVTDPAQSNLPALSKYTLSSDYSAAIKVDILYDGNPINLYLQGGRLYLKQGTGAVPVGTVNSQKVITITEAETVIKGGVKREHANAVHKATISGRNLVLSSAPAGTGGVQFLLIGDLTNQNQGTTRYYFIYDLSTFSLTPIYVNTLQKKIYLKKIALGRDWLSKDEQIGTFGGTVEDGVLSIYPYYVSSNAQDQSALLAPRLRLLRDAVVKEGRVYLKGTSVFSSMSTPTISDYKIVSDGSYLYIYDSNTRKNLNILIDKTTLWYDDVGTNTEIGNLIGTLDNGRISLKENIALSKLGISLHTVLQGAQIINTRILKAASSGTGNEASADFRISQTVDPEGKRLYDLVHDRWSDVYLNGEKLVYHFVDKSAATEATVLSDFTKTEVIGTVSNNKISLPSKSRTILDNDEIYDRLNKATIKGQGIYRATRVTGTQPSQDTGILEADPNKPFATE